MSQPPPIPPATPSSRFPRTPMQNSRFASQAVMGRSSTSTAGHGGGMWWAWTGWCEACGWADRTVPGAKALQPGSHHGKGIAARGGESKGADTLSEPTVSLLQFVLRSQLLLSMRPTGRSCGRIQGADTLSEPTVSLLHVVLQSQLLLRSSPTVPSK